jgi:hypothetical protein
MTRKQWLKSELKRINRIIEVFPFRYEVTLEGKKMIREGIRTEYDKTKEVVDAAEVRLAEENKKDKPDEKIVKDMTDMAAERRKDMVQFEEQLKELDKELDETEMTKNSRIEAARSYKMLIKRLLKNGR